MNVRREGWSIVLAGGWNPRIFTPTWLAKWVFAEPQVTVEFPTQPGMPYRFAAGGVRIIPSPQMIVLAPTDFSDAVLQDMERRACTILEVLPHTPLIGVGTNFGFVEEDPNTELLRYFEIRDTAALATAGYSVETIEIQRRLTHDGTPVNFKLSLINNRVLADFNFHRPATDGSDAAQVLRNTVLADRETAQKILSDCYDFDLSLEVVDQ